MYYSKAKKFLSSLLIFSILFSISFRVPFFGLNTYAGSSDFYELVSIIVDEDTYDEIDSELNRYAKDIQGVLENTKVVILPTPKDTSAFNVASLNESLYFGGYKSVDSDTTFESKLVGTVIVGDLDLPIVYDNNNSSKTIVPFTDFEDKVYIYNHETSRYEKNNSNLDGLRSEIWHGVISPNFGDFDLNINGLKDYFDKNHDFYVGSGNFKYSDGILNGSKTTGVPSSYEPYVFYFDQFREEKALNYNSYVGYKAYLENKEDILYSRYSKALSDKITEEVMGNGEKTITELLAKIDPSLASDIDSLTPSVDNVPDIQTRNIIDNVTKKFIEIFAGGVMGEFRKNVYNAGRYNGVGGEVNVDMIPYIISVLDIVNDQIIKEVNDELEKEIDDLVKNGLSRKIAIPSTIESIGGDTCNTKYTNILYGTQASSISSASQCSIFRGETGSGQLVELNRGYNFSGDNALNDGSLFGAGLDKCSGGELGLNGYYGGSTPLNINTNSNNGDIYLNYTNYKNAIYPIYDIAGGKINYSENNIHSPLNCLDNNFILTYDEELDFDLTFCETSYSAPINNQSPVNFICNGTNPTFGFNSNFEDFYKSNPEIFTAFSCNSVDHNQSNDFYDITISSGIDDGEGGCIDTSIDKYTFKFIPSYITHKSPTVSELQAQIKSMVTPNLAIDKNRYIDFISAKGNYEKIYYPTLFRLEIEDDLSFDTIDLELENILNEKSEEINNIINLQNPSSLLGDDNDIYNLLKTGNFPSADFDLVEFLKSKEDTILEIDGESKTISYYDSLVFALYWDKLNTVSSKYAFIFDYYLTDQFGNEDKFFLPKNKKEYEIAYLGAPGDAQNMYVKIDPEAKADNPYSDVISGNIDLSGKLLGSNISNNNTEDTFKCAPPEGVPIWEWIPAVMCRLGDMMPPTISISDGNCGPSLLTPEEREELVECNGDINKNGINDCIESKIGEDGVIELSSDSDKYFYNKSINLKAELKDKDLNTLTFENSTNINFEVVKIEKINDGEEEIVFDYLDDYKNDTSILNDYIYFTPSSVRTTGGISNYGFSSKSNDSNIYLKANVSIENNLGDEEIFIESEVLKIEIRGDRLFNSSYKLINDQDFLNPGLNSVKVSDKNNLYIVDGTKNSIEDISNLISNNSSSNEKLVLVLENISISGNKMDLSYPLDFSLTKNGEEIDKFTINSGNIDLFKGLFLQESGSYEIEITDSYGFKTNRNIELVSDIPTIADINIGTTIQEVGGNVSTNFVTLYDKYGNVSSGDFYDLSFEIDGDGLTFLSTGNNYLNSRVFEGYEIFRLKSGDQTGINTINIIVSDISGNKLIEESKNIEVVDKVNVVARALGNDIKVGGDNYKYEISIRDNNGNILNDFDSRVYLTADPLFIDSIEPYFEINSGIGEVEFKTKNVAGKNVVLEFQIEGLSNIVKKEITILPDSPMKMDLILSQSKIEADSESFSNLLVELKDRYDNIVFNDNSTSTNLEILDQYKYIITIDSSSKAVSEGKANYKIYGTQNPGVAYFKVGTNPSLSINSFTIEDDSGDLTVYGVGENVGKIETFYFWNKDKLEGKKYNSIYTTLLGSNYGDITQKDYLAGSLLFDYSNRSLAVTSVLNNVNSYSNIVNISENGGLDLIYNSSDLSQDIELTTSFIDDKLALNLYNNSLNTYIGKVFYAFENSDLNICDSLNTSCFSEDEKSISLGLEDGYLSEKYSDYISVNDEYGKALFEIYDDGKINKFVNLDFKFIENNISDKVFFEVSYLGKEIARLGYNLNSSLINTSYDEDIFNSKINSVNNAILVLLKTKTYLITDSGNIGDNSKILSYNDPFSSDFELSNFSKSNSYGYENFHNQAGIGWEAGNKSLLEFASGKSVGDSVKDFMSFSTINLGDPVISLKKIKKKLPGKTIDRQFDSGIGKLLSSGENITDYRVFDYDNDSREDILIIKNDKNLSLLENKDIESDFIDKGDLVNIVDLGSSDLVQTGDFSGDGYDDIFFVNNEGIPFLLNNEEKNFVRLSLETNFALSGRIIRAESFDMDNDGLDDIVTLDDSGALNIFYGGGSTKNPSFTKLTLGNNYGVTLNSEIRNDNSLVYFDGLYQPSEVDNQNARLDNYLYVKYPYNPEFEEISYEESMELDNELGYKYFIKSEFSDYAGIEVSKVVTDLDGGVLKSGDTVKVDVKITNVSGEYLYDIAIAEKAYDYFTIDSSTIASDIDSEFLSGNLGYTFLIDSFDLYSGEEVNYSYEAKVKPLSYSHIEVGLFESGEVGDDNYGDVIIKPDNSNCSNPVEIFRSLETVSSRSYQSGMKEPICDEGKIKLPEELEKNTIDTDGNGVPDYIDNLSNSETALKNYSEEKINELTYDSDGDGIPDNEDIFNLDGSIVIDLGEAGEKIDGALDDLENLVNGLSCGFGNASCWASPMNWAPLAPGNDPTLFGKPIGDGLKVDEGYPILSGLTGYPLSIPCGTSTCTTCIPSVYPASSYNFDAPTTVPGSSNPLACTGGDKQPGGALGVDSITNTFRVFVTPTLTGGVGTAICFGGPARVAGNSVPKAIAPLFPGGNCIVVAKPLPGCESDGSDGDVRSTGIVNEYGSFGIINGNCENREESTYLQKEYVKDYIEQSSNGPVEELFEFLPGKFSEDPIAPSLINGASSDISVGVDFASLEGGNFEDIIQIQQQRVSPFPSWIMDWVTRQIEEIVNKLTDFPTVFVILPEFEGVFDLDWGEASGNTNVYNTDTINIDENLSGVQAIDDGVRQVNSGIKEAYEFIGSTPLVYLTQETINISLPWMSESEINRVVSGRENTFSQRQREIQRASEAWSFGASCNYENPDLQQKCEEQNDISNRASLEVITNLNSLLSSLRANLDAVKSYKEAPEKINKLINKKEDYLEQILCNIEEISSIMGGRLGKNGERFKAWVETYILIKAILKSWQLLVDVFVDYEQECHECKNERNDLLDYEFKLIYMIVPKIPIIKFPKWPDIILDLHNIRAGLNVALPEFNITTKPILLPSLPDLYLPDVPSVNMNVSINLPEIPVLPSLEIPELPDLPTLPKVNLPDLPPPPTLPKMFGELEVVLDIIKLITKAMCILKSSPLHPEWRAGDQIAFLTERTGYLSSDFFDLSLPEFGFPFIDAIKVTTYVNLEFESEFIVELARQIAMPLNAFTNDFTNIFNINSGNLDFRNVLPTDINIDVDVSEDGVDSSVSGGLGYIDSLSELFVNRVGLGVSKLQETLETGKSDLVGAKEFKKIVSESLSSTGVTSNPKMEKVVSLWEDVNNYNFSKEDKIIKDLKDTNNDKFEALKDIINTEIIRNKQLKEDINEIYKGNYIQKVGFIDNKIDSYNESLSEYNDKFKKVAKNLVSGNSENEVLKEMGNDLLSSIKTPLNSYNDSIKDNNLLSATTAVNSDTVSANSCQAQNNSDTGYNYEGIYVVEGETSYRLFDYIDDLSGDEKITPIDYNLDGDEDLLYLVKGELYLKQNLEIKDIEVYVSDNPIVLNSSDNKFYSGDIFYESVNGFDQVGDDSGNINISFLDSTNSKINNYRVTLYTIVDKFLNEFDNSYIPKSIKKDIIDSFAGVEDLTIESTGDIYTKRKNLGYIDNLGNSKGLILETKELINIRDDLSNNIAVNIIKGTKLYSGDNSFSIDYILSGETEVNNLTVSSKSNIELNQDIKIIGLSGDAYIKGQNDIELEGTYIRDFIGKPLFDGSKIYYSGFESELLEGTYVEIRYYDNSEALLDFDYVNSWEIYDLGFISNDYYIRLSKENDYYYAKINSFSENIFSSDSKQILISPQIESDIYPPELSLNTIRIPVYQTENIDLTNYIYENSGLKYLDNIYIDFDLLVDSDGNGNSKDDNDSILNGEYKNKSIVSINPLKAELDIGPFDNIFKKTIGFNITDDNLNTSFSEVELEVYAPIPEISDIDDNRITGYINEDLDNEPVNIYRYRGGVISSIYDSNGDIKSLTQNGDYQLNLDESNQTGLSLYYSGQTIANIDEFSGKINLASFDTQIKALSSTNPLNDVAFVKIILEKAGEEIFYQYISVNGVDKVSYVDTFDGINDEGIYFMLTDTYSYGYYEVPLGVEYNPGSISVYRLSDVNKENLFTVFKDGRINTANYYYKLEYDTYEDYIVINLIDSHFDRQVAKVLFKVESDYIMK